MLSTVVHLGKSASRTGLAVSPVGIDVRWGHVNMSGVNDDSDVLQPAIASRCIAAELAQNFSRMRIR